MMLPPDQVLGAINGVLQLGQAHFAANCLYAMVKLGVPDVIRDGKLTLPQIVSKLPGAPSQEALLRCMRLLALHGVFVETPGPDGEFTYALGPAGALLQTGLPQPSMACGVLHWIEPPTWGAWGQVPGFVAGEPGASSPFERANGLPVFDFYKANPASAKPFNEFMSFFSAGEMPVVLEFGGWEKMGGKTVVDVGGSLGVVMEAVAAKFPDVKCVVLDLPEVIEAAEKGNVAGVTFKAGDMFDPSTIPACDYIFMKHILHDWEDEACVRILQSCKQALRDDGEVLVCDAVLPEAGALSPAHAPAVGLDVMMLTFGGKERTRKQWEALGAASNLHVKEIKDTPHPTAKVIVFSKSAHAAA